MSKLVFRAADVRRVVEHTLTHRQRPVADWSTANEQNGWEPQREVPPEPTIVLVHDDGVYLMSNGDPRDIIHGDQKTGRSFVAYAEGCHPDTDPHWYDTARDLVGGDDFAENLPWARQLKLRLDLGAKQIVLLFTQDQIEIAA